VATGRDSESKQKMNKIDNPVDTKAAIFAVCAAAFLFAVGFAVVHNSIHFESSPATSGSGPSAPGQNPKDTPQKK
jgi:hypothetical protein